MGLIYYETEALSPSLVEMGFHWKAAWLQGDFQLQSYRVHGYNDTPRWGLLDSATTTLLPVERAGPRPAVHLLALPPMPVATGGCACCSLPASPGHAGCWLAPTVPLHCRSLLAHHSPRPAPQPPRADHAMTPHHPVPRHFCLRVPLCEH